MRHDSWMPSIARTGFGVSLLSYIGFWLADVLRPGMVTRYLSVHIFLLAAIVFAVWWSVLAQKDTGEWRVRAVMVYGAGITLGLLLAAVVWNVGAGLADYRLLLAAVALGVPIVCLNLIRSE